MERIFEQMVHTWSTGGWVMAAIALLALVMYATASHLLLMLYRRGLTRASDADVVRWVADPAHAPASLRELVRYTQDGVRSLTAIEGRFREVETSLITDVDRRLTVLKVMVVASPLFGLLGTVLGMLLTFKAIGVGGSNTAEIAAKGISEALVATQTGILVALPGLLAAHVAKVLRHEYVAFLARLEGITLRHFRLQFRGQPVSVTPSTPVPVPALEPVAPQSNPEPVPA